MYSLIACNDLEVNKAKGVNLELKHNEYVVLFGKKVVRHKMKRIQGELHRICTYDIKNLSCFRDKGYVLDDRINTLAYRQKDIVKSLGDY